MKTDTKETLILFLVGASFAIVVPCAMVNSSAKTPISATTPILGANAPTAGVEPASHTVVDPAGGER